VGVGKLFGLGELSSFAVKEFGTGAQHFQHIEELLAALETELGKDSTVLVKGSRFMRMERVVKYLVNGELDAANAASAQH